MTTTERKTTTSTAQATFANLIKGYEQQALNRTDETAYTTALKELATAVTYSVLKKCIDTSHNKTLKQARQELTRDTDNLNRIKYITDNAYETRYNKNGDMYTKTVDGTLDKELKRLLSVSIGNGYDLLHTAIIAILSETEKAKARDTENGFKIGFMEQPYSIRRLKRKVWIKTADSVNGWETVETNALREVYKAVRREIESNRAIQGESLYTYLDETVTDSESGIEETIFRRFGKYADIGGMVTDYNGKETLYTTDEQTVKDTDTLIESLNLTAKQAKVLSLRQSGYGYKAIATYLGITQRAVAKTVELIQKKAVAIGLNPTE